MRIRPLRLLLLTALVSTSACIDDPTAVSDDPLPISAAEAEILGVSVWRDIMTEGTGAFDDGGNVRELIDFVRKSDDGSVEVGLVLNQECEFGGDRIVDGRILGEADETGTGFVEVEMQHDWEGCAIRQGDLRVLVEGEPSVDSEIRYDFDAGGDVTIEGRMEGAMIVRLPDGRSGSCGYSVTFSSATAPDGRFVFRKKGIVCGEAVNSRVLL